MKIFRKGVRLLGDDEAVERAAKAILECKEDYTPSDLSPGQDRAIRAIRSCPVTFITGQAGTGKTHVAMLAAIEWKKRIVVSRPVVESGEKLGYLPGTMDEKLAPFIRPLEDAAAKTGGRFKPTLEVAPLAFMRGRTFDDSFVILDEGQNTTVEQMILAITRLGVNSKMVITGDEEQSDLRCVNGLTYMLDRLESMPSVGHVHLTSEDQHRNPVVQEILDACRI